MTNLLLLGVLIFWPTIYKKKIYHHFVPPFDFVKHFIIVDLNSCKTYLRFYSKCKL